MAKVAFLGAGLLGDVRLALDDPQNDELSSGTVVRSGFLK